MRNLARIILQVTSYAAFAVFIGWFSASPSYQYSPPQHAVLKLSLSHAADRVKPCVRRTPKEIAELAPNMRQAERCERQRLPVTVEILLDDEMIMRQEEPPSGLWGDGPSSIYEKLTLEPGKYRLSARLRDSNRADGWDYQLTEDVSLQPGRYLTVTFKYETGGFRFR